MTVAPVVRPTLWWPKKLQPLFRPKRYKILRGGRGGAKSWGIARALIKIASEKKRRVLCAREFQNSIAESVHHLLSEQIQEMGLSYCFNIQQKTITSKLGSQFIFAGIRTNPKAIKSMEDVDICWVEEAENVSKLSWKILIPTIRKEGSEIWVSYNPDEETDPTHAMAEAFIKEQNPDAVVIDVNHTDNPWFPDTLRKEMEYAYKTDPDGAEHVWGGKCNTRSNAQIFKDKYIIEAFEPLLTLWNGPYFGQDFGFSVDPAATLKMWISEQRLYIEKEFFGYQLDNDELNKGIRGAMPEIEGHIIRADNARPETIHEMGKRGLGMVSCKKWAGCVEDGIQYLRSFEKIIIHPRCKHMKEEARLYRYKVDRLSGDILPIIVDANNHGWDGVRYGLEPMILNFHEEVVVIDGDPDGGGISSDIDEAELMLRQDY